MRARRATAAAVLALGLTAAGAASPASAAGTGFAPVHTLPYQVDALTSPDGDTVVAVSARQGVVDARVGGTWVHTFLGNSFDWAGAASDGGVVWVATRQNSSYYSTLHRSNNGSMEWVNLPPVETPSKRLLLTSIAAEGPTVVLGGVLVERGPWVDGVETVLSRQAVVARYRAGTWEVTYPKVDTTALDLAGAASGRVIARTTPVGSDRSYVYDVTSTEPGWYGTADTKSTDDVQTYRAATYDSGYDFSLWGGRATRDASGAVTQTGLCKHFGGGTAVSCSAPAWPVSDAERLADGRVVVAGGTDATAATQASGIAVVGADGTVTPVPGAATNRSTVAASAFGTRAWVATPSADGTSTTILEADLAR